MQIPCQVGVNVNMIETTFKVNYPGGFCSALLTCSLKKKFVLRDNLQHSKVTGVEDALDSIDNILSVR